MHGATGIERSAAALLAPLVDGDRLARDIDEPLRQSASIMFQAAQDHCEEAAIGSKSCRAYHAVWQYLRLAGVRRAVRVDGPLFVAAAERMARDGRLGRVLISGTADYSMLAHIAHGARRGGVSPSFDVVDRCATSLRMNDWYGVQSGLDVRTIQSSILAFQPEHGYDLICTHSFLDFIPLPDRAVLFQRWSDWLTPGGKLCFSNFVSERTVPADVEGRSRRILAMTERAIERLTELGIALPCERPRFEALIREAGLWRAEDAPAMSLRMINAWIVEAGLEIEVAEPVTEAIPGEQDPPMLSGRGAERPRLWFQIKRL